MYSVNISFYKIKADRFAGWGEYCRLGRRWGRLWQALAVGVWLSAATGFAATIYWGPAMTITSANDVYTNGTALYAYYWGSSGNQTVNGVTFTANNVITPWGNVSFSSDFAADYGAYGATTAPFSGLSTAYQTVLQGGDYGSNPSGIVTMNGLTIGHQYSVQIWLNDSRTYGEGRYEDITGTSVQLIYNSTTAVGGVGQYSVGTFVANATNQSITLNGPALQFNAISVRDNGIYNFTPTRVNLAKYQPVLTDSATGSQVGSFITDGLTCNDSYWQSGSSGNHWAQVVFPFPVSVGSIQLAMGLDTVSPPLDFELQYLTNSNWINVSGGTVLNNTNKEVNVVFTTPITASSFRFYDPIDGTVYIREMALYPPSGTNGFLFGTDFDIDLARKQPVFATANTYGSWPLLAVDGRISPFSAWETTLVGSNSLQVNLQYTNTIGSAHLYSGMTGVPPLTNFVLQYLNLANTNWQNIPGGSVSGNTNGALVIPFTTPVTTTAVQLVFTNPGVSAVQELCVFSANNTTGYPLGTGVTTNSPITAKVDTFTDSYYYLSNAVAEQTLVESNGVPVLGLSGKANYLSQYQALLSFESGTYRVINRSTGLCLAGAQLSTNAGAQLMDEPYSALPDQEWFLQPVDGTNYFFVNRYSGLALDTLGGSTAAGTTLVQNVLTNSPTQRWQFALATIFPKKGVTGTGSYRGAVNNVNRIFNANWCYNWGATIGTGNSLPTNVVYNPMSWSVWAGASLLNNIQHMYSNWRTNSQPVNLLGYNEPDQVGQSDINPTNGAIEWHGMNNMDMPLAAPACANVNSSWNNIFFGYITNWGLRTDYLPGHEYVSPDGGSSDCWIVPLQTANNSYGLPMWMTEFDIVDWSGTNDTQTWTEEDNYTALAEFLWRAESVTWLRKYSLYDWPADPVSFPMAPTPWTLNTPHVTAPPVSHDFDTNDVLTPYGELYAAWDEDANVETNRAYFVYNSSTRKRLSNTLSSSSPNAQSILMRDSSVQWTLVNAGSANLYYLVSAADGRRLSYSSSLLSLVAPNTTGTNVQWLLSPYQYGWYYLQHPATGKELSLAYTNSTFTANYSMVASSTTGTAVEWRFVLPMSPLVWTGVNGAFWASSNWNSVAIPTVGQPVAFNSLSASNLYTALNSNCYVSTITLTTPTGPVFVAGTNKLLTIGSGIDLSGASQDLTINAPLVLGGSQPVTFNMTVTNTHNLNINSNVNDFGNVNLNFDGGGTVSFGGNTTYAGSTTINAGILTLSGTGQLANGSYVTNIIDNGIFNYGSSANQTIAGIISGTGSVIESGLGTLTLSGENTYTGTTSIGGGTLAIAGAGTFGGGTYTANITNNGTFNYNSSAGQILSGMILGTGVLNFAGTGGMNLNGTNTYSGGTTISNSDIVPGNGSAYGTGVITINSNGTSYAVASLTFTNPVVLNGGWWRVGGGNSHQLTASGPFSLTASSTIFADGGTGYSVSGQTGGNWGSAIFVNGSFNMGSNNSTLSALGQNGITINGSISGANGTINNYNSGTYLWLANASNSFAGTIRAGGGYVILGYSGSNSFYNATIDMNAADAGSFYVSSYPITIGGLMGSRNLTLSGAVYIGANASSTTYSGVLGGTGPITKTGAGTLTISGTNAYAGSTTVSAGTLALGANQVLPTATSVNLNGGMLAMSGFNATVNVLQNNGLVRAKGTWGASGSGANHISAAMTGTGILTVATGGASSSVVTASANPSNYGTVTFTNTVTGSSGDGSAPSGTVTFYDGAIVIGTGTLTGSMGTVSYYTLTINSLTVGTHSITASYAGNASYDVSTSGVFSQLINPAISTATLTVNNSPVIYSGLGYAATITLNGTNTIGAVTNILTGGADTQTAAGTYVVTATFVPSNSNYTTLSLTATNGFTISPASLTITANSTNKVYGRALTLVGFTTTGLTNVDTVTGATLVSSGAAGAATVGSYPIAVSGATGTGLTNYSISYVSGSLAVAPLPVGFTGTRAYDGTTNAAAANLMVNNPVNSDVVTVASGNGGLASAYVGTNAITTFGTLSLDSGAGTNYTLAGASGYLVVTNTPLVIMANSDSKTYDGNPYATNNGVSYVGFVAGETNTDLAGSLTFGGSAEGATTVGRYTITASGCSSSNYLISYVSGLLTINQATPVISAAPTASSIFYGQPLSASTLSGGSATPAGSFAFTAPATIPPVGTASYAVNYTPTDMTDYTNATTTVSVTVNPACTSPSVVGGIAGVTNLCAGSELILTVTNATGTAPLYYQWATNNMVLVDATNASYTNLTVAAMDTGNYTCVVTNGCGSVTSAVVMTINSLPTVSVNSTNINAGGLATLMATTTASNPTYLWSPGGATTPSITVSPATNTTYTVVVTDGTTGCVNGGSGTVTILVSTNALLASLSLTPAGTLYPTFASGTISYNATNTYANRAVVVAAGSVDSNATLQLMFNGSGYGAIVTNSLPVSSETLVLPTNLLAVQVVSQDLSQTNVYSVNVLLQPSQTVPHLTNSVNGNTLSLSWSADHLGYLLLVQTNNLNKGVSSNLNDWGAVAGSTAVTTTNLTIIRTGVTNEYYRLAYPF